MFLQQAVGIFALGQVDDVDRQRLFKAEFHARTVPCVRRYHRQQQADPLGMFLQQADMSVGQCRYRGGQGIAYTRPGTGPGGQNSLPR